MSRMAISMCTVEREFETEHLCANDAADYSGGTSCNSCPTKALKAGTELIAHGIVKRYFT